MVTASRRLLNCRKAAKRVAGQGLSAKIEQIYEAWLPFQLTPFPGVRRRLHQRRPIVFSGWARPSHHPATTSTGRNGFTAADRKTVLNFLLQFDMGKTVQPGVVALTRSGDQACAVRLVMDTYDVPQETAELVVRLFAQSEGRADLPQASECGPPAKIV